MCPELLGRNSDSGSGVSATTDHLSATFPPHPRLAQHFHCGRVIFTPTVQLLTLPPGQTQDCVSLTSFPHKRKVHHIQVRKVLVTLLIVIFFLRVQFEHSDK